DRLEVPAHERAALRGGELGEARREIDLDDPSAAAQERRQRRAERPPERELDGKRQLGRDLQEGEQQPRGPVARAGEAGERKIAEGVGLRRAARARGVPGRRPRVRGPLLRGPRVVRTAAVVFRPLRLAGHARAHAGRRTASYTSGYGAGRPLKR